MVTEDVGEIAVDVVADFTTFEAKLRAMLASLARRLNVDIPVNPDTKRATFIMEKWRKIQSRALEIKINVQRKAMDIIRGQLKSLTGVGQLGSAFMHFNNTLMALHENILLIGLGIGGLGSVMGPFITLLGSLTMGFVDVVAIAGKGLGAVLLAVPGIFAGVMTSVLVFTSAMKDAEKTLGRSLEQYKELQKVMSANFWKASQDQIRGLLDHAIKPVRKGFEELSTAAGSFTGRLADEFKKVLTEKRILKYFGNLSKTFKILEKTAAKPLAEITANLLEWGSGLLPQIATWLGKILTRFSAWLDEAIRTGKLNEWLRDLGGLLERTWKGLKGFAGIFTGIADAAEKAGISAFPLADTLERISTTVNSEPFQSKLVFFFQEAKRGAEGMKPALESLERLFENLTPIISRFIGNAGEKVGSFVSKLADSLNDPSVLANFESLLDGLLKAFENLEPAIDPAVQKVSEMMKFAGILSDTVSGSLAQAIEALAPAFSTVLESFEGLTPVLGEFIEKHLERMEPIFGKIGDAVAGLVEGITVFIEALNTPVVSFILGLIVDAVGTAVAGVFNLIGGVMKIVGGLLKLLSGDWSGFADIWDGLKQGLLGAWQLVISVFAPAKVLKWIGGALKPILPFLGKFFGNIPKLFSKIPNPFTKLKDMLLNVLDGLPQMLKKGFIGKLESLLKGGKDLANIGKDMMKGLLLGMQNIIGGLFVWVNDHIIQPVLEALGIASPSTIFMEMGVNLIQGLLNGIQSIISFVVEIFTGMWENIKLVFTTALNAIILIVTTIWDGIVAVITTVLTAVWDAIQFYWNLIVTIVTTVMSTIKAVLSAAWEFIKNYISTTIENVKNIISKIMETIKSVWSTAWNTVKNTATTVWNSIKSFFDGAISKMRSTFDKVGNAIKDPLKAAFNAVAGFWNNTVGKLTFKAPDWVPGIGGKGWSMPKIPKYAVGTNFAPGGMALVGERGPELVNLPRGSKVFTNSRSERMMGDGGPTYNYGNISVTLNLDDLDQIKKFEEFLDMVSKARVNSRRTQRSGYVAA